MRPELARIVSNRDPSKVYVITLNDNGDPHCTCPAFMFSRKKTCKHIESLPPETFSKPTPIVESAESLTEKFTRLREEQWKYLEKRL